MMHEKVCKKWGIKGMDNLHKGSDINVKKKKRMGVVNYFWWSLGLVLTILGDLIGLWWRYTIISFKSKETDFVSYLKVCFQIKWLVPQGISVWI